MDEWFVMLAPLHWKPLLGTLAQPPVPLLALALLGVWWLGRHRWAGRLTLALSLAGLWAMCTTGAGTLLVRHLTRPPPPLDAPRIAALVDAPRTAIVVLGAGRRSVAPEFAAPDLKPMTLERLRYGVWLARQTHLPLVYSGGVGLTAAPGPTEAAIAQRVAARDFQLPLHAVEAQSRDTSENAHYSVALLHAQGFERVVVVTHDFHQQRALAAFARAIARQGVAMAVVAAPLGGRGPDALDFADWLPSPTGFGLTHAAVHEWLGWLGGA